MNFIASFLFASTVAVMVLADSNGCIYIEQRYEINCRGGRLYDIPCKYFENKRILRIDLGANNITSLDNLERCLGVHAKGQIETILLDNNQIRHLPLNLFATFSGLKELDLSYNKFKHIPRRFCHMSALTYLNLNGNDCGTRVAKNAFSCNKNLTVSLENCKLNDVDNFERTTPTSTKVSTTTTDSLHTNDRGLVEETVKKNGKGSAASASANLCIIVPFLFFCILISVFYKS